jgi:hypothetical protein
MRYSSVQEKSRIMKQMPAFELELGGGHSHACLPDVNYIYPSATITLPHRVAILN